MTEVKHETPHICRSSL